MHNASLFTRNVRFIAKEKGIRIGDLERSVGLRPGYLSRWEDKKDSAPRLDVACRLADAIGESLSDLVQNDYKEYVRVNELQSELRQKENEISQIKRELERIGLRRLRKSLTDDDVRKYLGEEP